MARKSSKTQKLEKYAILWLNSQGKTAEFMQDDLGLDLETISKTISKELKTSTNNSKIRTASNPASMIKDSASGKQSVAVMTKNASEKSDSIRPKVMNKQDNGDKSYIFKIS